MAAASRRREIRRIVRIDRQDVRVVGEVESFRQDLETHPFSNCEVTRDTGIQVMDARSSECAALYLGGAATGAGVEQAQFRAGHSAVTAYVGRIQRITHAQRTAWAVAHETR